MRTFIILLLLTNLAYFGWNQGWLREPAPAAPKTAVPAVSTAAPQPFDPAPRSLTLIAELSEAERAQMRAVAPAAVDPLPVPETGGEQSQAGQQPPLIDEGATGTVAAARDPAETEQNQVVAEASQPEPEVAAGPPWCADLGQFTDAALAEALVPALAALGVTAQLRTETVPVSSTFWVYMPAFASEDEARRMLAELQGREIDSYYMRSGQFSGGISLGVFSRRASAETVRAALAAQGYTAQIGEVFREEPRSLLALQAPDAGVVKAAGWADFMAKNPGLQLTENVCESVASGF
jgi:cell division protein FtsN